MEVAKTGSLAETLRQQIVYVSKLHSFTLIVLSSACPERSDENMGMKILCKQ